MTVGMDLEDIMLSEMSIIRLSDRERWIPYVITYMWNRKTLNSQKQNVEWWLPEAEWWGKWENLVKRYKF